MRRTASGGLAYLMCWAAVAIAQHASLRPALTTELPEVIDGNSAVAWDDSEMLLFHSSGVPTVSRGRDQFSLDGTQNIRFDSPHRPVWFEAAWRDDDGTLFLWYHHEPSNICPGNKLTAPKIGAAISRDNGRTVEDLGIVLESAYPLDCNAKNGFFAGGHGDASVIVDRERKFIYFLFTNYSGPVEQQGVSVARMPFEDRWSPAGAARKFYNDEWNEPGLGGRVTPLFPASRSWSREDAESFWGPSIHWNTFLEKYVVLMNKACCRSGWQQEGVYITYTEDLSDPYSWRTPDRLLHKAQYGWNPGWYPQVIGLRPGETDNVAGEVARLYIHGRSQWEIVFSKETPPPFQEPPNVCQEEISCPDIQP